MPNKSRKPFILIVLALVLLGALAFALVQSDWLKGRWGGSLPGTSDFEETVNSVEAYRQDALDASVAAMEAAGEATVAADANDATALAAAQADAVAAAEAAEAAATTAEALRVQAEEFHNATEAAADAAEAALSGYQASYLEAIYNRDFAKVDLEHSYYGFYNELLMSNCTYTLYPGWGGYTYHSLCSFWGEWRVEYTQTNSVDFVDCANTDRDNASGAMERGDYNSTACLEVYESSFPACDTTTSGVIPGGEDPEAWFDNECTVENLVDWDTIWATWGTIGTAEWTPEVEAYLEEHIEDYEELLLQYQTMSTMVDTSHAAYTDALAAYSELNTLRNEEGVLMEEANRAAEAARNYATQARASADAALSLSITALESACSGLAVSPSSYEMAAEDTTADFDITVGISTTAVTASIPSLSDNLKAFTLTEIVIPTDGTSVEGWTGTLRFQSSGGSGSSFFSEDGITLSNPYLLNLTEPRIVTMHFTGGSVGETITVSVDGEETNCSESFTITQADPTEPDALACTGLTVTPSSYEIPANTPTASFDMSVMTTFDYDAATSMTALSATLSIKTDGAGGFSGSNLIHSDGTSEYLYSTGPENPYLITLTENSTILSGLFSGGVSGDTITVEMLEYPTCASKFTLTGGGTTTPVEANIVESSGTTAVTEGGATDSYTVALTAAPSATMGFKITPDAQLTVTPSSLIFDATNWSVPQMVTVTAVDDSSVEGTHSGVLTHSLSIYDTDASTAVPNLTATITDNDTSPTTPTTPTETGTISVSTISGNTTEAGGTATFTMVLSKQPTADVSVGLSSSDTTEGTVSPSSVTFTTATWSTPQTITVTGVADSSDDADVAYSIITAAAISTDAAYNGVNPGDVSVTNVNSGEVIKNRNYRCTDPFTDTNGEWFADLVCRLYQASIIQGRTSTTFVPADEITRAEWIKVMVLIFGHDVDDGWEDKTGFYDVSANDWFYPYLNIAEDEDVIRTRDNGYYFYPNEPITRADAILYAVRFADQSIYDYDVEDIFEDVDNEDYFAYALAIAYGTLVDTAQEDNVRVIEGYDDDSFKPYNDILRSEAMAIAYRVSLAWGIASEDWED
ncbi:MAG: S-layer homology domain-containing protein [Candidatus Gracilibacteria bacterium]|jgi:hypothetical protein